MDVKKSGGSGRAMTGYLSHRGNLGSSQGTEEKTEERKGGVFGTV
jgi:hypothetical protein